MQLIAERALRAVLDLEDIHYALTWREGRLESEGWIRTREGTPFGGWLERTAKREPLSPTELAELRVDDGINGELDALEAGGKVASETMVELRSAKLALDRMVYLARIAQGIEGESL